MEAGGSSVERRELGASEFLLLESAPWKHQKSNKFPPGPLFDSARLLPLDGRKISRLVPRPSSGSRATCCCCWLGGQRESESAPPLGPTGVRSESWRFLANPQVAPEGQSTGGRTGPGRPSDTTQQWPFNLLLPTPNQFLDLEAHSAGPRR